MMLLQRRLIIPAHCLLLYISYLNADHVPNMTVCDTTLDDSRWEEMNLNGNCELYIGTFTDRVSPCDSYFTVGLDYVYIPQSRVNGSQREVRLIAEDLGSTTALIPVQCKDIANRAVCYHLYLPCGNNSNYHLPRFVCQDVCNYISEMLCPEVWTQAIFLLNNQVFPEYRDDPGLILPNCSDTDELVKFLNMTDDCCTNAGIVLPNETQIPSSSLLYSIIPTATSPSSPIISGNVLIMIILAGSVVTIIVISLLFIVIGILIHRRKRKNNGKLITSNTNSYTTTLNHPVIISDSSLLKKTSDVNTSSMNKLNSAVFRKLSKDNLIHGSDVKLMELIGQGEFGIVYHGLLLRQNALPTAVAVKTLKGAFNQTDIEGIIEETLKMKQFDHFNVLSLIGVCLDFTKAPCIVMPYMSEGSLLSYLRRERPQLNIAENASIDDDIVNNVTKQLLSMCLQIANGMEYLINEKFVHRDLAARNCMMSVDGVIKVADFGLTEDVYAKNYFRVNFDTPSQKAQIKLPIKWMALESIHDGLFSEKTDVWSYGILCWEIFSLGKVPYPGLSPKEVVDFLDSGQRLDQPKNLSCTSAIFTFIVSCWNEKPEDRMNFREIVSAVNELIKPFAGYMEFKEFFSKGKVTIDKDNEC